MKFRKKSVHKNASHNEVGDVCNESLFCKNCGVKLPPSSNYCPSCGERTSADVPPRVKPSFGTFTDSRTGHVYRTAKIGSSVWMCENLDYMVTDDVRFDSGDPEYNEIFTHMGAVIACPVGWHLPTKSEWNELNNAIKYSDELSQCMYTGLQDTSPPWPFWGQDCFVLVDENGFVTEISDEGLDGNDNSGGCFLRCVKD